MSALLWVDGLFAEFCASLSGSLREEARRLSHTLGFAPEPFVPWSQVFSHEVTLAAPSMLAEAMPSVPVETVRHALFAHAMAVIEAMGIDRIEDGQVEATPSLRKVLGAVRACRDEELGLVAEGAAFPIDPAFADLELIAATRLEREILCDGSRVDLAAYESLSERKQAPGMVASALLAARAGLSADKVEALHRALLDIAMGLQLYDDVVDWEHDAAHGRSWAVALTRSERPQPGRPPSGDAAAWRAEVHASGMLARMLRRARSRFEAGATLAAGLHARRLVAWSEQRAESMALLADRETQNAGYVNRAHALAPWARAVLAPRV